MEQTEVMTGADVRDALRTLKDLKKNLDEHYAIKAKEIEDLEALLDKDIVEKINDTHANMTEGATVIRDKMTELETQIKQYILTKGESVIVDDPNYPGLQAVYSEGRLSWDYSMLWSALIERPDLWAAVQIKWDTKVLKTMAIQDEDLLKLQSKGSDYVSIKGV